MAAHLKVLIHTYVYTREDFNRKANRQRSTQVERGNGMHTLYIFVGKYESLNIIHKKEWWKLY